MVRRASTGVTRIRHGALQVRADDRRERKGQRSDEDC